MSILITGASGFLGKNLCKKIPDAIKLYFRTPITGGIECNLNSIDKVKYIFDNNEITGVVHCAANPSPKHPEKIAPFLDDHILATTNLLECSKNIPFVYISSVLVYGNNFPHESPSNLYGACKLSCEKICEAYSELNNLQLSIIRPSAIVGPGLTHGLVFDIYRKLRLEMDYLELFGNEPGTIKPFVHVNDVINYIMCALIGIQTQTVVDCFPQTNASVKEVAETIMDKLNIHKPIKWLGEGTIWKGDNKLINTSMVWPYKPLKYSTSIEAIKHAV